MKKTMLSICAAAMVAACANGPKTDYVINGTLGHDDLEATVVAMRNSETGDTIALIPVADGKFTYSGKADSTMSVVLMTDRHHLVYTFIEPGDISVDFGEGMATGTGLNDAYTALQKDLQAEDNQGYEGSMATLKAHLAKNKDNEVGRMIFGYIINLMEYDEVMQILQDAPDRLKELPETKKLVAEKRAAMDTAEGTRFVDFPAVTMDGEATTLGAFVGKGRPLVVDFWASWCGPCRMEISKHLKKYAADYKGKVDFVGVAVWEQSMDDTRKAMDDLEVSWPVIFTGHDEGPTKAYGIKGIPHIMLIGNDGIIKARDLRGEDIKEAIDKCLNKE